MKRRLIIAALAATVWAAPAMASEPEPMTAAAYAALMQACGVRVAGTCVIEADLDIVGVVDITLSGDVAAGGAVEFTGTGSGTAGRDRIYHSAANGLSFYPDEGGSSYDFILYNSAGASVLLNPAGTQNLTATGTLKVSGTEISLDSAGNALVEVDKASTSNYSQLNFDTAGVTDWQVYTQNASNPDLTIYDQAAGGYAVYFDGGTKDAFFGRDVHVGRNLYIPQTDIYLDSDYDSWLHAATDDTVDVVAGNVTMLRVNATGLNTYGTLDAEVSASETGNAGFALERIYQTVSSSETNYRKALVVTANTGDIASGVTDSGYRVAFNVEGYWNDAGLQGTLATSYGAWIRYGNYAVDAAFTNTVQYGVYIEGLNGQGNVGTSYALYVEDNSGAGVTTPYAVFQQGTTPINEFQGAVRAKNSVSFTTNGTGEGGLNRIYNSTTYGLSFYADQGGSSYDFIWYNDAGATVMYVPSSGTEVRVVGQLRSYGRLQRWGDGDDGQYLELISDDDVAAGTYLTSDDGAFFMVMKESATAGGARLYGQADGTAIAMKLMAHGGSNTTDTTKTSSGWGLLTIDTADNATSSAWNGVVANGNLVAIQNASSTRWLVDAEGDTYRDGSDNTFALGVAMEQGQPNLSDGAALIAWEHSQTPYSFLAQALPVSVSAAEAALERAGILAPVDPQTGRRFYNESALIRLVAGAASKNWLALESLRGEIGSLRAQVVALTARLAQYEQPRAKIAAQGGTDR